MRAGELVIVSDGYASASIASIARAAEIGVGSIYHYFSDKDALLDWAVVRVLRPGLRLPSDLPIGAPPLTLSEAVAPYLNVHVSLPYLHEATARVAGASMRDELQLVIRELFDLVESTDRVQTMVEVCSNDLEELRRAWFLDYRRALVDVYETYFRRRIAEQTLRPIEDPTFAARWLLDTVILFLRLRRLDYYPDELPTEHLREHVVDMLLHGFAGKAG